MSVFPADVNEALNKTGGRFIKSVEFEEGLTLQVIKVEKIKASIPKYGAQEKDYLVKNEILDIGETFKYHFKDAVGAEKELDSASAPLCIAFQQAGVEPEDWVKITRSGETFNTRFVVEKVESPVPPKTGTRSAEDTNLDPDAMPF